MFPLVVHPTPSSTGLRVPFLPGNPWVTSSGLSGTLLPPVPGPLTGRRRERDGGRSSVVYITTDTVGRTNGGAE